MSWEDTPFFDNVWPFAHVHNELFVAMTEPVKGRGPDFFMGLCGWWVC